MVTSDAQKRAAAKWQSQNIDRLSIVVPRGQRDAIKAAAAAAGESVNAYIIGAINARMSGTLTPSPSPAPAADARRKAPAPEQPARKSPEQPQRPTPEELLEQRKAKLSEQVAEIQRKEEARAEEEAKKEAERQKLIEEGREILRQFVIQFNREQARLAGEGKKFKEWDDLYDQDQGDILHAAGFRDYREVYSLQELTPRERKARGFPLFDEKPKKT